MKILFIQNLWQEYFGVSLLASILKNHGHECDVLIEGGEKDFIAAIIWSKPDIIAFPCQTGSHRWAIKTISELRKKINFISILGGPHPTFYPSIIEDEPEVDIISIGESEESFRELANALRDKEDYTQIKNLWVKQNGIVYKNELRPLIQNLDVLPDNTRDIYYLKYPFLANNPTKNFISGRGCPYKCTFCFHHSYLKIYEGKVGKYVRKMSVRRLIDEISHVKNKWGMETVCFVDDTFLANKAWLREFAEIYPREVNIPFFCGGRVDEIDIEIATLLKKAGCYMFTTGIETGNEQLRNQVYEKKISNKQIIEKCKLLKSFGIKVRSTNIFCGPTENTAMAWETIHLNIDAQVDIPFSSLFQPYPGIDAANSFIEKGVTELGYDKIPTLYYSKSILSLKDKNEIYNLQRFFYFAVKFPSSHFIIRKLIKLPTNPIFDLIFFLGFILSFTNYKRLTIARGMALAFKTFRNIYLKTKK